MRAVNFSVDGLLSTIDVRDFILRESLSDFEYAVHDHGIDAFLDL